MIVLAPGHCRAGETISEGALNILPTSAINSDRAVHILPASVKSTTVPRTFSGAGKTARACTFGKKEGDRRFEKRNAFRIWRNRTNWSDCPASGTFRPVFGHCARIRRKIA